MNDCISCYEPYDADSLDCGVCPRCHSSEPCHIKHAIAAGAWPGCVDDDLVPITVLEPPVARGMSMTLDEFLAL